MRAPGSENCGVGIDMSEVRYCEVCGYKLHPSNVIGICKKTSECRNARQRLFNNERRAKRDIRLCEVCGTGLQANNKTGVCHTNPECRRVHAARYWETRYGTNNAACAICRKRLSRRNKIGVCTSNPECSRERDIRRYEAEHGPSGTDTCEMCGVPLRRDCTSGICTTNPTCRAERNKRAHRERAGLKSWTCDVCGKESWYANNIGVCGSTSECLEEYHFRWHQKYDFAAYLLKHGPQPYCELCGIEIRRNNLVRVCTSNLECARENGHRLYQIDPERRRWHARRSNALRRTRMRENPEGWFDGDLLWDEQCGLCARCGSSLNRQAHLDHIWPVAKGGGSFQGNFQWLCFSCNLRKTDKVDPLDPAQQIAVEMHFEFYNNQISPKFRKIMEDFHEQRPND